MLTTKNKVLGIGINNVDIEDAYNVTKELVESSNKTCKMVFAPNTEFIMKAQKDEEFYNILNQADLATPDSVGVMLAGKFKKEPFKQRIPGQAYFRRILAGAEENNWSIYILGGKDDTPDRAVQNIKKLFPKLNVVGFHEGFFEKDSEEDVIKEINSLEPNILFVAMGAPLQEKWIYKHKDILKVDVAAGQGGTLDYEADNVKRAPEAFQKMGIEWLWRLIKQPSRIGRMMVLPVFFLKIVFTKDISKGKFDK